MKINMTMYSDYAINLIINEALNIGKLEGLTEALSKPENVKTNIEITRGKLDCIQTLIKNIRE